MNEFVECKRCEYYKTEACAFYNLPDEDKVSVRERIREDYDFDCYTDAWTAMMCDMMCPSPEED